MKKYVCIFDFNIDVFKNLKIEIIIFNDNL